MKFLITVTLFFTLAQNAGAIETARGVVRESDPSICPSACSGFYLEPDPGFQRTPLDGDFSAYLNLHVEVKGFRDLCSGCFILIPTVQVTVLPPLTSAEDDPPVLPEAIRLSQNYPNPFNPSTTIEFALTSASAIDLSVFTPAGEKVATLVSGIRGPGRYRETWNAIGFPSGAYICRLTLTSVRNIETRIRRMMLLR